MANIKPVVTETPRVIDASESNTFKFTYSGNQPYKNRLVIYSAAGSAIYDQTITTLNSSHIIPPNTLAYLWLENCYAQIQTFDANNDASLMSDEFYFTISTRPNLNFTNITDGQMLNGSSFEFTAQWTLEENGDNERLYEYSFELYLNGKKVSESGILYPSTQQQQEIYPFISYQFKGFSNNESYMVKVNAKSIHGFEVFNSLTFQVSYLTPQAYSIFEAENKNSGGYITCSSNIVTVTYNGANLPIINSKVNLIGTDGIYYSTGFSIDGDFQLQLRLENPTAGTIFHTGNDLYHINLICEVYSSTDYRYKLEINNSITKLIFYSSSFTPGGIQIVKIIRVGNRYDLIVE